MRPARPTAKCKWEPTGAFHRTTCRGENSSNRENWGKSEWCDRLCTMAGGPTNPSGTSTLPKSWIGTCGVVRRPCVIIVKHCRLVHSGPSIPRDFACFSITPTAPWGTGAFTGSTRSSGFLGKNIPGKFSPRGAGP